jgi:pimeloyl-ACP methyl ester carboxylesterase
MPFRSINGVRIGYDESGAGPSVVWVHGGFTDRRGLDLVVPLLADRYRVIAYDRRGHSESERRPGRQAVADHVADLATLLDRFDAAPAHLLANSDGGEVALKLALRRPDLVASLCLHEPSLYGILPDDPAISAAVADMTAQIGRIAAELERGNDEAAARMLIDGVAAGPGAWDALPEQSRRTFIQNAPTWLDTARDPAYGVLDADLLPALPMPVLVTGGAHSHPADVAVVARLAGAIPHASRHTFAGAGHVPHRTRPKEFARVVGDFLDTITTGREPASP